MIYTDRLRFQMEEFGLSQSELARRVGVSQATIYKLVSGTGQGSKHLHVIADELGTTPGYLTGVSMNADPPPGTRAAANLQRLIAERDEKDRAEDQKIRDSQLASRHERIDDVDQAEIDSIDLAYGMGGAYLDSDIVETEKMRFPLAWLRQFTDSPPDLLTMAHGIGDSMEPTISDRDSVLIDRGQSSLKDSTGERIWAAVFGGVGVIKRLRPMPNGTVKIMSDNPLVSDDVASDGELFIIGRVVGKSGRL